jgi:hypothetical protein
MITKLLQEILAHRIVRILRKEYDGDIMPMMSHITGDNKWYAVFKVVLENGIHIEWSQKEHLYTVSYPNRVKPSGAICLPATVHTFGGIYPLKKLRWCIDTIITEHALTHWTE